MLLVFGQHVHIEDTHNVFIYLVTYRPIGPGAFCVFVYVIVYNYVNVCTSHNNKPINHSWIVTLLKIPQEKTSFKIVTILFL